MKSFFKFHLAGILLSILIGLVVALPPIIFHFSSDYQGIEMLKTNTEPHYVSQIQEVYDGHPGLGNPFFADLKDSPYLFPPLSPNVVARFGQLLHISVMTDVMLVRFLAVSILAFLIYLCVLELSDKRRLPALVAAAGVILGYSLLDPHSWINLIQLGKTSLERTFIDYGRPINPQISSLFFFAYLVCLLKGIKENAKRGWLVAAAIIAGLSFYVYLFTWTFIFSLNGFLAAVALVKKKYTTVKQLVAVTIGAGIIGIPYLLHTLAVSHQPYYAETSPRFGFVKTHDSNISRIVIGALVLFLAAYRWLTAKQRYFFAAFFITAFFVVNEQVITGQFVFNHHYHWYYNTPLVIILVALILDRVAERLRPTIRRIGTAVLVLVCVYNGILMQVASYKAVLPAAKNEQRLAPLFSWLNSSTPKDSTVVASSSFSNLLPALTHNNVYYPDTAIYTLVSNDRLFNTFLVFAYLDKTPTTTAKQVFETERAYISGYVYGYTYSFQSNTCSSCFPDSNIDTLTKKYAALNDQNFISYLKQYPADYIVWDTKNDPKWGIDRFKLPEVVRFGDLRVYSIH